MEYKYIGFDGHYGGDEYERVLYEKLRVKFPQLNFAKKTVKRKGGVKSILGLLKLLVYGQTYSGRIVRPFGTPIFRKNMTVILHHYDQSGSPYYTKILEYTDKLLLKFFSEILNIKFFTVSEHWSNWVMDNFNKQSYIIYNEIKLDYNITRDKKYISDKYKLDFEKRWVFVGGNQLKKGGSMLIEYLQEKYPKYLRNLQIIQTGSKLNDDNDFSRVVWIESVDYLSFINSCDLIIANSQFSEGWCRILHEAALLDKPIAGSGNGGMGELLELTNGKSSYTIDELAQMVLKSEINFKPNKFNLYKLKEISNSNLELWFLEVNLK